MLQEGRPHAPLLCLRQQLLLVWLPSSCGPLAPLLHLQLLSVHLQLHLTHGSPMVLLQQLQLQQCPVQHPWAHKLQSHN
jgi:hypothetical protein